MNMFDEVVCETPLPDGYEGSLQSKSFDCVLDKYKITADGELWRRGMWLGGGAEPEWEPVDFTGFVNFYGYDNRGRSPLDPYDPTRWHEYRAQFYGGKLVAITTQTPA